MGNGSSKYNGLSVSPPWIEPTLDSEWFDLIEDLVITSVGVVTTLVSLTLPTACLGRIKWFGQEVKTPNKDDKVEWKIKINDGPDKTYGSVIGRISTIEAPTETFILIPRAGTIKLDVIATEANIRVIGRLKGWFWIEDWR